MSSLVDYFYYYLIEYRRTEYIVYTFSYTDIHLRFTLYYFWLSNVYLQTTINSAYLKCMYAKIEIFVPYFLIIFAFTKDDKIIQFYNSMIKILSSWY